MVLSALLSSACSNGSSSGASAEDAAYDATGSMDVASPTEDGGDGTTNIPGDAAPETSANADGGADTGAGADAGTDTGTEGGAETGPGTQADTGPGTEAGQGQDASMDAPSNTDAGDGAQGPCNTIANTAPVVISTIGSGSPPPATGGTLVPGTYYLTGYVVYPSIDAGSNGIGLGSIQETVVLSGSTSNVAIASSGSLDGGVGPSNALTETLTTNGTSLTIAVTCGQWTGGTFPYSVATTDAGTTTISALLGDALLTLTKQ
jgi:hypothetical protein